MSVEHWKEATRSDKNGKKTKISWVAEKRKTHSFVPGAFIKNIAHVEFGAVETHEYLMVAVFLLAAFCVHIFSHTAFGPNFMSIM